MFFTLKIALTSLGKKNLVSRAQCVTFLFINSLAQSSLHNQGSSAASLGHILSVRIRKVYLRVSFKAELCLPAHTLLYISMQPSEGSSGQNGLGSQFLKPELVGGLRGHTKGSQN